MDQASASPAASCAHNPAAPRTLPSWQPSEDQARTVGPPPARSSPRSEPHSEPVHIVPRPSSPALCQSDAKGYLLPDFYSGCATGIPGRLTEGLLLWRSQLIDESKQRRRNSSRTTRYLESAANSLRPAADDNQGCAFLLVVEARQQSVIEPVICPFALAVRKCVHRFQNADFLIN